MEGGSPSVPSAAVGATFQSEYMGRTMKCYPVHETEMESLATLNTQSTAFFSVGSALIALAAGILTNAAFADHLTAAAMVACLVAAPALVCVAAVYFWLGREATRKRSTLWMRITGEAIEPQVRAG